MKISRIKNFRSKNLETIPLQYVKNSKALEKAEKDQKKTDTIKFKGKNPKKSLFLLLKLS